MHCDPSPKVKRAAWTMFEFVRRDIAAGMASALYSLSRPAKLHDELRQFLDVYDPDDKYKPKKR